MIRRFLRLTGFLVLAAGFVALVIDGARALATGTFAPMRLGVVLQTQFPDGLARLQTSVARDLHPFLWDYALAPILAAPAFVVGGLIGLVVMRLGRRPPPTIGFAPRP